MSRGGSSELAVIVPTLDSVRTLGSTLDALAAQSWSACNLLVMDSGSGDGTIELCRSRGLRVDFVPKGNIYRAINAGLSTTRSEWVTYLNSDDLVYQDSYARLIRAGENAQADVVFGDCNYIDIDGKYIFKRYAARVDLFPGLLKGRIMPFAQPSAIIRRSLYERLGGFDEKFRLAGDLDFFGRAWVAGAKFCRVDGPTAEFRVHAGQLSIAKRVEADAELDLLQYPAQVRTVVPRWLALAGWRLQNVLPLVAKLFSRPALAGFAG